MQKRPTFGAVSFVLKKPIILAEKIFKSLVNFTT